MELQTGRRRLLPVAAPLAVAALVALAPVPTGLAPHAWHFFALFAGVVVALVLEPLPNAAVGIIGVFGAAAGARWILFSPAELARPAFDVPAQAVQWALSGFHSAAVWLVFAAFMFGLGYERTGLGRRIALVMVRALGRRTLTLGYAVMLFDVVLAPFTPSNTARSAGTVFPVVQHLPPLFGSHPHDPSARRVGGYLMWTAYASSCLTSTLFLTALAPNLIAVELIHKTLGVEISWGRWFAAAAPFGIPMLLALPLLVRWLYPPSVHATPAITAWADGELDRLGPVTAPEWRMAALALAALALWVFADDHVNATTVAFLVIAAMLLAGIVSWRDMMGHDQAWDALLRIATLVTLADGLHRTGFITWAAQGLAVHLTGLPAMFAAVLLVVAYFLSHYLFATTTAHAVAVLPVMIPLGNALTGIPVEGFTLLVALTHGIMGVVSPYATGPSPVYHASGYITYAAFWRLGALFGAVFIVALLLLAGPGLLT